MAKYKKANLEKALKSIIQGPSKKKIKIAKHGFNVKKVDVVRKNNRILVNGNKGHHLSHRLKFRPDDQIFYEFEVDALGRIQNAEIKISKGSDKLLGWLKKAKEILEFIDEVNKQFDDEPGATGKADSKDDAAALVRKAAAGRAEELLDGSWRGEAMFIIANVMLMFVAEKALSARKQGVTSFRPRRRVTAAALLAA